MTGGSTVETRALSNQALGRELTAKVIPAASGSKLEHAARERRSPQEAEHAARKRWPGRVVQMRDTHARPLVQPRQVPLSEQSLLVRRFVALLCILFENADLVGDNKGRAAGRGCCLGRTRAQRDGVWTYVPKASQGGAAARVGVDVRTLEQMIAVLVNADILRAWQPPAYDQKTGVALPPELRGETYAYGMYTLVGGLPAALAGHLARWDGLDRQRAAAESPALADGAELIEPSGASFDEQAAAAAYRIVTGHDPPPRPS